MTSSSPRCSGSTGSTIAGSSAPSVTSHPRSTKRPATLDPSPPGLGLNDPSLHQTRGGSLSLAERDSQKLAVAFQIVAPGHQHPFLGPAWTRGQVDGVEKERQKLYPCQAAGAEGPVAVAQLLADPAGAALGELAQARLCQKALQVAVGEAAHVGADDERLQRPGTDHGSCAGDGAADERLDGTSELRHLDEKLPLACLQPSGPHAVAPALGGWRALVAGARQELAHLLFHRALDDELGAEAPQFAQAARIPGPVLEQTGMACSSRALAGILFSTVQS